jgi:hypothetical protein
VRRRDEERWQRQRRKRKRKDAAAAAAEAAAAATTEGEGDPDDGKDKERGEEMRTGPVRWREEEEDMEKGVRRRRCAPEKGERRCVPTTAGHLMSRVKRCAPPGRAPGE